MNRLVSSLVVTTVVFSFAANVSAQETPATIDISAMSKKDGAATCRAEGLRPDFRNGVCANRGKSAQSSSKNSAKKAANAAKRAAKKAAQADKKAAKRAAQAERRALIQNCKQQGLRPDIKNNTCAPKDDDNTVTGQ